MYRSTATFARQRKVIRQKTAVLPVNATVGDDLGVDRIAVEVDGHTRGVDWNGQDGWSVSVPCTPGTHTFTVRAYDAADNAASGAYRRRVTC